MKRGTYLYVEFFTEEEDQNKAIENLRQALNKQPLDWVLSDVEFEDGEDELRMLGCENRKEN